MSGPPAPKGRLSGPTVGWPEWSKAGKCAALEAASSSIRGRGCAPSGPFSPQGAPSQPELLGAPRADAEPTSGTAKGAL
eukprot:scaffold83328_cov35-Phaeocystis_antarctica.AAC.2